MASRVTERRSLSPRHSTVATSLKSASGARRPLSATNRSSSLASGVTRRDLPSAPQVVTTTGILSSSGAVSSRRSEKGPRTAAWSSSRSSAHHGDAPVAIPGFCASATSDHAASSSVSSRAPVRPKQSNSSAASMSSAMRRFRGMLDDAATTQGGQQLQRPQEHHTPTIVPAPSAKDAVRATATRSASTVPAAGVRPPSSCTAPALDDTAPQTSAAKPAVARSTPAVTGPSSAVANTAMPSTSPVAPAMQSKRAPSAATPARKALVRVAPSHTNPGRAAMVSLLDHWPPSWESERERRSAVASRRPTATIPAAPSARRMPAAPPSSSIPAAAAAASSPSPVRGCHGRIGFYACSACGLPFAPLAAKVHPESAEVRLRFGAKQRWGSTGAGLFDRVFSSSLELRLDAAGGAALAMLEGGGVSITAHCAQCGQFAGEGASSTHDGTATTLLLVQSDAVTFSELAPPPAFAAMERPLHDCIGADSSSDDDGDGDDSEGRSRPKCLVVTSGQKLPDRMLPAWYHPDAEFSSSDDECDDA